MYFEDLKPETVRVELYANGVDDVAPERVEMKRVRQLPGAMNGYTYRTALPAARPASDYTVWLIAHCDDVAIPPEDAHILWRQ